MHGLTDFRKVDRLEVFQGDHQVANLIRLPRGCQFRYTDEFLASRRRPIARHLPANPEGLLVEGLANLPTYFAGLLPEGIMFSAVQRLIGAAADDLFAVLAATGADAVGDISVRIPGAEERRASLNLAEAAGQIQSILEGRDYDTIRHLAAISGVQPKLSLGELVRSSRTARYIAKFNSPDFPNLILNEYVFTRLAKRCRLRVSKTELRADTLVIQRFDRWFNPQTKMMQKLHVEDMVQVMNLYPNGKYSMEYGDLLAAMEELGVSKATLLEALKLYVFSYIIGNGDLHAKNVSLIVDQEDGQWRLSPSYDLISTLPYQQVLSGADRMALALADEAFGRFTMTDFVGFGSRFGLPKQAVVGMVDLTARLTLRHLHDTVRDYFAPDVTRTIAERAGLLRS